jgi:hypothetical protein
MDKRGVVVKFLAGAREFSFLESVQTGWWALGVPSASVNRPDIQTDHSLPSNGVQRERF